MKNSLNREIIQANPDGGICVDFDSLSISNQKNIYVLGDLTKGTYLYTNSYLICLDQAALIAKSVLRSMNVSGSVILNRDIPIGNKNANYFSERVNVLNFSSKVEEVL